MNIKHLFFIFALVVQVRSDCDDYLKCLGDLIHDFFGDNENSTTVESRNVSDDNSTDISRLYNEGNNTISVFDLSEIGKSISQALTDVTTLIKDELAGMFNIEQEADVHKDIDNKTVILVRTFGFNIIGDNGTNIRDTVKVPAVIVNNFTEFNDELNALKVEIEKNLQAELEAFISKITDNDTLDWEEVTEDTSLDNQDNINEFKSIENTESSTEMAKAELNISVTSAATTVNNVSSEMVQSEIKTESPLVGETKEISKDNATEITTTFKNIDTKPETSTKIVEADIASTVSSVLIQAESDKIIENKTNTVSVDIKELKNYNIKTTTTTTTTTTNPSTTYITKERTEVEIPVSSTTTITNLPENVVNVTTTVAPIIVTVEAKDMTVTAVTTTKPIDSTTKTDATTPNVPTKPRIDYKLIENIHENEISKDDISYYDIQDDNSTDYPIIDYIELYKDTTNEEVDYKSIEIPVQNTTATKSDLDNTLVKDEGANGQTNNGAYSNDTTRPESIFPWIVTIFIKNDTNNQFDYYCDGVLLSTTVVITAGRCVIQSDKMVEPENVLIFLGKRSLQVMNEEERISKVKKIRLHEDFEMEGARADNDLAALLLEEPAEYNDVTKSACIMLEGDFDEAVTTAWGERLTVVPFVEQKDYCDKNLSENAFCATYGSDVALCPSYGGAYAVKQTEVWCLRGIRSSDVTTQKFCFEKTVVYTDLAKYTDWIEDVLNMK